MHNDSVESNGKIYIMTPIKGGSEYKHKDNGIMELVTGEIYPGEIYYIRPTDAPRFYQTVFSSRQHIEQINELLNAKKIWQKKM